MSIVTPLTRSIAAGNFRSFVESERAPIMGWEALCCSLVSTLRFFPPLPAGMRRVGSEGRMVD